MRTKISILSLILIFSLLALSFPSAQAVTLGTVDQKTQDAYTNARAAHQKALTLYSQALNDWQQAKNKLDQERNTATEETAVVAAQNLVIRAGESMIAFLELLRTGVENIQGITDAERTKVLAEIDKDLAWLRSKKEEVRVATQATEIKDLALEVKNYWSQEKANVKRWTGTILAATANRILSRLDGVVDKVNAQIDILRDRGQDVTSLESLAQNLEAKVNEAQSAYSSAANQYKSIKNLEQADEFFQSGRVDLKTTDSALREAYKILRDIIQEIKNLS